MKQEYACTPKGVLVLLLWFSIGRKASAEKHSAKALFMEFLRVVIAPALDVQQVMGALVSEFAPVCGSPPIMNGVCQHVVELLSAWSDTDGCAPADRIHAALVLLYPFGASRKCECLRFVYVDFFDTVASLVQQKIHNGDFEVRPSQLSPGEGGGKRRKRIDEHYKMHVVTCSKAKRAKTGRALLRAYGDIHPSLAGKWEAEHMLKYLAMGNRAFYDAKQISLCQDCARLGDPPEETLVSLLWTPQGNHAIVPPPQVLARNAWSLPLTDGEPVRGNDS